jgi:hypothetical protein
LDVFIRRVIFSLYEVLPFWALLLEGQDGQTWKDHVYNCVPYHLLNMDGQIDLSLVVVHVNLQCMLCEQSSRAATMLICDQCSWNFGIWDALCHPWKCQLTNYGFAFSAPSGLKFLRLDIRINLVVFFHGDSHVARNLKICR